MVKAARYPALRFSLLTLLGVLCADAAAAAQDRGMYIGVAFPIGNLDTSFDKTVDNRAANTLVPEPRRGMVFQEKAGADGSIYGAGAIAGFRVQLGDSGVHVGGEVDVDFRGGTADGEFEGIGTSPGRNQLGEFWPDQWTFEGNRSYGIAIRLGGSPAALQSSNTSVYALGGYRWLEGTFTNRFHGCLSSTPCSAAPDTPDFTSGTEKRDTDLKGWVVGLGAEKTIRSRLALRLEARHTRYRAKRWVTPFEDVNVTVPAALDADEWSVVLGLAWYL